MSNAKPDILDCLANLSSDEVFTPPKLANEMLDLLPRSLWKNPDARFCDPFTKSGVFLREIVKRLDAGLADAMPDKDERIRHILGRQVYGVAITRLTALLARRTLYCNKDAHGSHAAIQRLFRDEGGLVAYSRSSHSWKNGACEICGASEKAWGKKRSADVENYAYPFLHDERIIKMAEELGFDVVIGNPPYQMSDGSGNGGAIPIYNRFVEQAMKLNPRHLVMIIPARWYGGGRGLEEFRTKMIHDRRIRVLHDILDAAECFGNGVEIKGGVCYFLWNRDKEGLCDVVTHQDGAIMKQPPRELCEEGSDVFIRYAEGVSIYHKVKKCGEETIESLVSSQKPFGLRTFVHGRDVSFKDAVKLYERGGVGYIKPSQVEKNHDWVGKCKVYISAAYNAGDAYPHQIIGKPIFGERGSACTETYIVIGPFKSESQAKNVMSYIRTRFFRFLVMLKKTSQHAAANVYSFVPIQDFSKPWTDAELYKKYGLDEKEISFIESMIRPMEEAR